MRRKFLFPVLLCFILGACGLPPKQSTETTVYTTQTTQTTQTTLPAETTTPPLAPIPAASMYMDGQTGGPSVHSLHNVTAQTGKNTTQRGVWGGNQSRVVTVGDTAYFAYLTSGSYGEGERKFSLYALPAGAETWQLLGSGLCTGDAVIALADANGRIYVATAGDHKPYGPKKTYAVWEYIPETGEFVEHLFSRFAGILNYNYFAACIDQTSGQITMLFCGGTEPGAFAYNTFDTNTKTFGEVRGIPLDFRHCYVYIQPDGFGGLSLQGGRDVLGSVLGYPAQADGTFPYAFDGVRYWHIQDALSGAIAADITIRAENPAEYADADFYPTVMNNYTGDCYVDHLGRTHILYSVYALDTKGVTQTFYCRIENGEITAHQMLWEGGSALAMVQDGAQNFYLLAMAYGGHVLSLYRCDENGENPVMQGTFTFPAEAVHSYAGLSAATGRSGTKPGEFADVVYPSGEESWFYFRLYFE